jgi:hypothetical protein
VFFAKAIRNDRHDTRRIADVADCGLGRPNWAGERVAREDGEPAGVQVRTNVTWVNAEPKKRGAAACNRVHDIICRKGRGLVGGSGLRHTEMDSAVAKMGEAEPGSTTSPAPSVATLAEFVTVRLHLGKHASRQCNEYPRADQAWAELTTPSKL